MTDIDNKTVQELRVVARNSLPDDKLIELRVKSVELGIEIANAKGKPSHAPYIAADIYNFILTGERPKAPDFVTGGVKVRKPRAKKATED